MSYLLRVRDLTKKDLEIRKFCKEESLIKYVIERYDGLSNLYKVRLVNKDNGIASYEYRLILPIVKWQEQ